MAPPGYATTLKIVQVQNLGFLAGGTYPAKRRPIVTAWFREDRTKGKELLRHLKRDEGVRSLCETPLLLSLLCIQFRHDLALPKRKTELFKRCIEAFYGTGMLVEIFVEIRYTRVCRMIARSGF